MLRRTYNTPILVGPKMNNDYKQNENDDENEDKDIQEHCSLIKKRRIEEIPMLTENLETFDYDDSSKESEFMHKPKIGNIFDKLSNGEITLIPLNTLDQEIGNWSPDKISRTRLLVHQIIEEFDEMDQRAVDAKNLSYFNWAKETLLKLNELQPEDDNYMVNMNDGEFDNTSSFEDIKDWSARKMRNTRRMALRILKKLKNIDPKKITGRQQSSLNWARDIIERLNQHDIKYTSPTEQTCASSCSVKTLSDSCEKIHHTPDNNEVQKLSVRKKRDMKRLAMRIIERFDGKDSTKCTDDELSTLKWAKDTMIEISKQEMDTQHESNTISMDENEDVDAIGEKNSDCGVEDNGNNDLENVLQDDQNWTARKIRNAKRLAMRIVKRFQKTKPSKMSEKQKFSMVWAQEMLYKLNNVKGENRAENESNLPRPSISQTTSDISLSTQPTEQQEHKWSVRKRRNFKRLALRIIERFDDKDQSLLSEKEISTLKWAKDTMNEIAKQEFKNEEVDEKSQDTQSDKVTTMDDINSSYHVQNNEAVKIVEEDRNDISTNKDFMNSS